MLNLRGAFSPFGSILLIAGLLAGSTQSPTPVAAAAGLAGQAPSAGSMVLVPAGEFWMGRARLYLGEEIGWTARERTDDRPQHRVHLGGFYMDTHEVTNEDYAAFVTATGAAPPYQWVGETVPDGKTRFPVYNLTWQEAVDYCGWAGKRLPTEAEWERAARGGVEKLDYPWGSDFLVSPESPPSPEEVTGEDQAEAEPPEPVRMAHTDSGFGPIEVGSFEPNGFGLYDTSGNVSEWVSDWYETYYYSVSPQRDPRGPEEGLYKVMRGGGWGDPETRVSTVYFRNFTGPDTRSPTVGFRCARSVSDR